MEKTSSKKRDIGPQPREIPIVKRSTFLSIVTLAALAATFAWAQPVHAADPIVILKTSLGEIDVQLDPEHAPITTANFLSSVKKGFYDGTIFHRVVRGIVAQGGGMTPDGLETPTDAPIKNEATNGLLLRRDIHSLFDAGYVTVTPDLHFEVSGRIRDEFSNGREYYALHGRLIAAPGDPRRAPSRDALRWHNEQRFRP